MDPKAKAQLAPLSTAADSAACALTPTKEHFYGATGEGHGRPADGIIQQVATVKDADNIRVHNFQAEEVRLDHY